jgi:5'-nucleotidase/UDP-sugar diphosphatase
MKQFRKQIAIFLGLVLAIVLGSCDTQTTPTPTPTPEPTPEPEDVTELTIFTMNDLHGQITEDDGKYGIARMASYINTERAKTDASVLIAAGDMFQGTGVSNYAYGEPVIKIMNAMNVDAMTCGNHEFDWNLNTIMNYFRTDTTSDTVANFPILGANIRQKSTGKLPVGMKDAVVVTKKGVKIGIVGYIGYGEESEILASMVEDYEFLEPAKVIEPIVRTLRNEEDCDIVIAMGHDATSSTNQAIAEFADDAKVDAIINAHTHYETSTTYERNDGYRIPCVQASSYSKAVGKIKIMLNADHSAKSATCTTANMASVVSKDSTVNQLVTEAEEEVSPIMDRVIGQTNGEVERYQFKTFAVDAMRDYFKAEAAFTNYGGMRSSAFPLKANSNITVGKIYSIVPFDNMVKTEFLEGKYIRQMLNSGLDIVASSNVEANGNTYYINGEILSDSKKYWIAAIDYIFDKKSYSFLSGTEQTTTGILFRDILIEKIEALTASGKKLDL